MNSSFFSSVGQKSAMGWQNCVSSGGSGTEFISSPHLAFSCVLGTCPGLAEQSKEEEVRPGQGGSRPSLRGPGRNRSAPKSRRGEWTGREFGPLLRMFQKSLVSYEFCSINGETEAVGPLCANIKIGRASCRERV